MNIVRFTEKPTQEIIDKYSKMIEEYLSAHNLQLTIEVNNYGPILTHTVNGEETGSEKLWLGDFIISTPLIKNLKVDVHRLGIDTHLTDKEIWEDAWKIQSALYEKTGLRPNLDDTNDPYWKLWSFLKQ